MGIDISKITDAKLKAEYEKADKNNDGILSKKEAKDASIFDRKEFKADVKIAKNQDDANYINLVRVINEGVKKENLVETLKKEGFSAEYIKTVEKVMANDKDVKGEAERKIKRALNDLAKIEERQAKYTAVSKKFNELGGEEAKIEEETLKETKKALKEADEFDRKAYREFKNTKIAADGVNTAYDAIYAQTEETKARKVRREAIKDMKEDGTYGKSEREAIKGQTFGQFIEGERSNGFVQAKNQAAANRVEDKKLQTRAEARTKLGNKDELLNQAVAAGLIKEVDGKYDLTELSNLIERFVSPGDHELDKQPKYYEEVSERLLLTKQLTNAGLKVTEHDAVKLAKLCGFDVDNGLNITKGIIGAIKGFAGGAAAGALAEALNPDKIVFVEGDTIIHDLTVNVKGDFANIDMGNLPDGWEVEEVPGVGITIKIHQLIKTSDLLYTFGKDILQTGVTTGLAGAAIGLLGGMTSNKGEKPVVTTSVSFDTLKEYENSLKNHPYQFALSTIALNFTNEDGTLRKDEMHKFLEAYAGEGSLLGKDELLGALRAIENKQPVEEVQPVEKKEDEAAVAKKETSNDLIKWVSKAEDAETHTADATNSSWENCAKLYPCLMKNYKYSDAIRIIKLIQGINNGDFSKDNLDKLLAESRKGLEYLKENKPKGLDLVAYESALLGYPGANTKLPDFILTTEDPNDKECQRCKEKPDAIKKVEKPDKLNASTSAKDTVDKRYKETSTVKTYHAKFYINGKLTEVGEYATEELRNAAIEAFKEKNKDKDIKDIKWEEDK